MIGLVFVLPFIIGFVLVFSKILYDGLHAAFSTAELGAAGMTYKFVGLENFHYALRVDPLFIRICPVIQTADVSFVPLP